MMNRRHFLRASLLAGAAAPLLGRAAPSDAKPAKPAGPGTVTPGAPTVTAVGTDGVSVVWSVDTPASGFVEYGPTPALGSVAHGAMDGLKPFSPSAIAIALTGLTPGERVHYRTVTAPIHFPQHYAIRRGDPVTSPVYSFVMPGAGASARIAVWNDTHQQAETLRALGAATAAFAPDLLVLNGDLVNDQFNREKDFTGTFFGLDGGSPSWPGRPVAYVRGNHDARGALARDLHRFSPRPQAGGYHALLRVGPVGIIQLDTGDDKEGPAVYGDLGDFAAYREAQRVWLERAVRDPRFADAPYKIVFCHIPLRWRSPGQRGDWCPDGDARWSPLLAKAGVQAVVSGHTHAFWHGEPTASRPFHQVVSGGPLLKVNSWSPTPACLVTLDADGTRLKLEVVEAAGGKNHLSLTLNPGHA